MMLVGNKLHFMADKDKIYIFDTTMRDGEQSPGASMSVEEKIQISRVFDDMGIDIIAVSYTHLTLPTTLTV